MIPATPSLDIINLRSEGCVTPRSIEELGRRVYERDYVGAQHHTHDGQRVVFFANRFDHAFFRCDDFIRSGGLKNEIDPYRVERIHWIAQLIGGELTDSECHRMPNRREGQPDSRLYILNSECYVVWLEPLREGGWRFSTAYKPLAYQIKQYRKDSLEKIWELRPPK
jgi:hypothetical protein